MQKNDILAVLEPIIEPNLKQSIVKASIVENLEIDDKIIRLHLRIPYTDEKTREFLKNACTQNILQLGDFDVRVKMRPKNTKAYENPKIPIGLRDVRNVILVVSGKGGVGKSTVSTNLALALNQAGYKTGLLDADIYGPSIPTMMGIQKTPLLNENQQMIPLNAHGISLMSSGFLIEEDKALIWRGPMIHKIVSQFVSDVLWGDLDVLLIDLPPGTGDVQLSLAQSTSVRGAVLVTTPQQVAVADVRRANTMLNTLKIPVLGVIENMSGFKLPGTDKAIDIFQSGGGERLAEVVDSQIIAKIPLDPKVCECGDDGSPIVIKEPTSSTTDEFLAAARNLMQKIQELEAQGIESEVVQIKR